MPIDTKKVNVATPALLGGMDFVQHLSTSLSSPEMASQLAAGGFAPQLGKVVAAKFLAQMAADSPEAAAQFGTKLGQGDRRARTFAGAVW